MATLLDVETLKEININNHCFISPLSYSYKESLMTDKNYSLAEKESL